MTLARPDRLGDLATDRVDGGDVAEWHAGRTARWISMNWARPTLAT